jgi:hypothetical protein
MNSVERVFQYAFNLEQEADYRVVLMAVMLLLIGHLKEISSFRIFE